MSYTQNNPFSRKSSPLNDFDDLVTKLEGQGKSHESAVKIAGSVANAKMHGAGSGPTAKQKARHGMSRRPKEKPSTKPVEETRMTKGDQMPSRKSSSPLNDRKRRGGKNIVHSHITNKEYKDTRDKFVNEDLDRAEQIYQEGQREKNERSGEEDNGTSRKSSSPLNQDENERSGYSTWDKIKGTAKNVGSYISDVPGKLRQSNLPVLRPTSYNLPKMGSTGELVSSEREVEKTRLAQSAKERKARVSEGSAFFRESSPLNNTGMTGLNYSKELQYMPIEDDMHRGMSRTSSSPLDYGSWAHEDATRAKDLYKKGDYAHARALGIDEHDADYGKWKSSEAEHGPSRKSRSERLRSRAMKRSERSGAEWGDYDYEDKRVQKMLSKANELDERSGGGMKMMMTKHMKPLPKKKA